MIVRQYNLLKKKRINSKHWEIKEIIFSDKDLSFETHDKLKVSCYEWHNATCIKAVESFSANVSLIVMTALGAKANCYKLDYESLKHDAESAKICTVTNKKVLIAHCMQ